MTTFADKPEPFLEVRISALELDPELMGICAGFENGRWRSAELAKHAMEWLPEFCLRHKEIMDIGHHNAIKMVRRSAAAVYATEKFKKRGEFGELLLHIILRQEYQTLPAVSKLFYKDSRNDTVKGFDCVHVVSSEDKFELWLGEVKFYEDYNAAVRDVCEELIAHSETNYLRDEFIAITNKLDETDKNSEKIAKLLSSNKSLDQIFNKLVIPILLTYDSKILNEHNKVTQQFLKDIEAECKANHSKFTSKAPRIEPEIKLILFPLKNKPELAKEFDEQLKAWQKI